MASSGPNFPGTAAEDAGNGGSSFWNSASNATAEDAANAVANLASAATSKWLKCTGFGFSIPGGSTIDGIVVGVKRMYNATGGGRDQELKLLKAGSVVGSNKATATAWTTSLTWEDHGGASDLWGTTWTDSDVNASNFGCVFSCFNSGAFGGSLEVDAVRVTVHYTTAASGQPAVKRTAGVEFAARQVGPGFSVRAW